MESLARARLYGILDLGYVRPEDCSAMARRLISGGIHVLQLRAKHLDPSSIRDLALEIIPICRAAGVPFLINDHPEIAADVGADGVHVGQDDISVVEARRIVGAGKLVGLSTHSLAQVEAALDAQPDYIGFGPLFATGTKPDYVPIGTENLAEANRLAPFPVFCIGGIKRENLRDVLAAGARRVVIVSGILQAADPSGYVRNCLAELEHA